MQNSIQKIKSGDLLAFGDLYESSYDRVYRFLFYRTLDTNHTEDLISDVYMKAMKKISSFRGESEGEFYSWILQIAYTTFIDATRKYHDEIALDELIWEGAYTVDIDSQIDNKETLVQVMKYIQDTFSERDKNILLLRIWDDMSYDEIAQITGESVSNSKKIVSRSLAKIGANISFSALFIFFISHVITR